MLCVTDKPGEERSCFLISRGILYFWKLVAPAYSGEGRLEFKHCGKGSARKISNNKKWSLKRARNVTYFRVIWAARPEI
jgi:hypothetical protein